MFSNDEFEELMGICRERNIIPEKLLEEKLAPLQEKISKSQGELIGALIRDYEQCSWDMTPVHYSRGETLYAGLITHETIFHLKGNLSGTFVWGVNSAHSLKMSGLEKGFIETGGSFGSFGKSPWEWLYFMDRPPQFPEDSVKHGCFGSQSMAIPTEKSRLEVYIGDKQASPFLQQQLEGWRYLQLSKLLGYDFPMNDGLAKKIEEEQLGIFDKMRETKGEKFFGLLETAIARGYHETGIVVQREIDAGITMQINLKEFFSRKKELAGL